MPSARNNYLRKSVKRGGVKRHSEYARRPKARPSDLKGTCPAFPRKARFRDHEEAIDALHRTQNSAKRARDKGKESRRNERRTHFCLACKGYHLTSWETETSGPSRSNPDNTPEKKAA